MVKSWIGFCLGLVIMMGYTACGSPTAEPASAESPVVDAAQPAPDDGDLLAYARSQTKAAPQAPTQAAIPTGNYQPLTWQQLADVEFKETYYEDADEWLWYPSFGPEVTAKTDQPVYIAGYVIPVEPGRYVLSKNSFESCFFCGGAGPESVMELSLAEADQMFANDEYRTFKGTLRVNSTDIDRLNYILEGAEVVSASD
jgi:hypothetical protein